MGNCLSGCTARSHNGSGSAIAYAAGKFGRKDQTMEFVQSPSEKRVREYSLVQKELEALQMQITHSQAVLSNLKFTFFDQPRKSFDKVSRTTQTLSESLPKSLENVSLVRDNDDNWNILRNSCPAIVHNIAVQTEPFENKKSDNVAEFFLPPINGSNTGSEPRLSGIDLDVYRSCRKLSVLPEEEVVNDESPPGSRLLPTRYIDFQAHSFESYLLPTDRPPHSPQVIRQYSDPTTSRSTRRPLQVSKTSSSDAPRVQDSGLGSEVRLASPTLTTLQETLTQLVTYEPDIERRITLKLPTGTSSPETPFMTPSGAGPTSPNITSSTDTSLSFQTPTDITPRNESPRNSFSFKVENCEKPAMAIILDESQEKVKCELEPNPVPLARVSSKRRLVRSLARIGSEMPIDDITPWDSQDGCSNRSGDESLVVQINKKDRMDQNVFPNLSDTALKHLGVSIQVTEDGGSKIVSEDLENQFTSLVLAFKTDSLTLARRLELQNKLRDQAEINVLDEIEALKSSLQSLQSLCFDAEKTELFEKIRNRIDSIYKASLRVSSTAELYGAVQQENRLSKAVDTIFRHVENLKLNFDKEKNEHHETRKLLTENKQLQLPGIENCKNDGKRRASIATVQGPNQPETNAVTPSERRGSSSRRGSSKKCLFSKSESHNDLHKSSSDWESDSDESCQYDKKNNFVDETENKPKLPLKYRFRKRSSFFSPPWILKMMNYLQWLRPYENYALHARYCLAGVFVLAAIAVITSSFLVVQEN